jgi:hypothetical protein
MANRRDFLGGLLALAMPLGASQGSPRGEEMPEGLPLGTLEAVADTIVPRDRDPGALDAAVPALIVRALVGDADGQALYRDGLALVEARARERGAPSFRALNGMMRERILASLEGRPRETESLAARFYRRVRADVLMGYWASDVGQRAVGYDPPGGGYPLPRQP